MQYQSHSLRLGLAFVSMIALQMLGCGTDWVAVDSHGCSSGSGAGCVATSTPAGSPTPTVTTAPTDTPPPTPSYSPSLVPTETATKTATTTATSTATPTAISSATETSTPVPTATPTPTTEVEEDDLCPDGQIETDEDCTPAGSIAAYSIDITQAENPFPDDRYRDETGAILPPEWSFLQFSDPDALDPNQTRSFGTTLLQQIRSHATGWGVYSPIELRLSAGIDLDTLPQGTLLLRHSEDGWSLAPMGFTPIWHPELSILDLQPDQPLESATTYALVLTSAVKTPSGAPLGFSREFRHVLHGHETESLQPVFDTLATWGVSRRQIALAFTFTTQRTWQDLVTIRDRLEDGDLPAPVLSFEDSPSTRYTEGVFTEGPMKDQLLRGHSGDYRIAAVGTTQLYDFRGSDSSFDPAMVSGEKAPKTVRVRVQIAVPNLPVPEKGFPVVILGHGLGQSSDFVWDIAEFGSKVGLIPPFIMVAHDFPNHGARGTGNDTTDIMRYFHIDNFYAMRDSFRQSSTELLEIRRLVETATEPPFDLIDKEKILFAGASLGGITGATFLGVDSRVRIAMLSVPSGRLAHILEGEKVGSLVAPYIATLVGLSPDHPAYPDFFRMLLNRGDWIMAAGDSISYAPFISGQRQLPGATRKSVLIQEGIGDSILPNATTEDLARLMGIPTITSEKSCDEPGCSVSGMWQFDPADYGLSGEEPHLVSAKIREAQIQLLTYLATEGQLITDASPSGTGN